ncbi:nucleotidyltransferase [Mycoplasma sp. NEAQ87857]|uniref:nucleotidyltransferase n=1 Tax=Mycoplasma sp. NEAQ87857 TaxID=2683967 RepID=UPI00131995DC|nr:nucleotidyltransferase [Mycoplasma sp. NEAQ87857]QGZ97836.1 nucleotidyltransferase [Mycoplasma sp. NEAQ87857]
MLFKNKKTKVGIVVEYNPFHNGHIYQLNWIKENIPNSKIIVAMSGKYSQRGEITCASYRQRKHIAKKYGVSGFVKLPVDISAQAAHIFASNAVLKLAKKGIKYLVFGSETNDIELFKEIALLIKNNKQEYNKLIKKYLKQKGNSFPRATNLALMELANKDISMPNDILGLEYVKTIVDNDLDIEPISIQRTIPFHSEDVESEFASASKLRQMLSNNQDISKYSPMKLKGIKPKNDIRNTYPKFQKIILNTPKEIIAQYKMISEGMENLFKKQINQPTYDDFIQACTSKRYTSSRIKRAYLFVLLRIKK